LGFFNKNDKQSTSKTNTTIISENTFIKGGIETTGTVFIDGKFEGVIISSESLIIGKSGDVVGDIKVKNLIVSGKVDGIIKVKEATILPTGKILGKMEYSNLIIEKNGIFEGEGKIKNSTNIGKYKALEISKSKLINEVTNT
jgi:cytoskeletal protein CcmA (bactofilin family)